MAFFVSNFHIGKYGQNTFKSRLELNTFCMRFETLCGDKFEKKNLNGVFMSNFQLL